MTPFVNEAYADFSAPEVWAKAEAALTLVRSQVGRDYDLWIAGAAHRTGDLLISVNPSRPSEVVGRHHKATAELANRAIEDAHAYAPAWGRISAVDARACI